MANSENTQNRSGAVAQQDSIDLLGAVRAAVRKLGLRLESASAPQTFIVVDEVERPSEN